MRDGTTLVKSELAKEPFRGRPHEWLSSDPYAFPMSSSSNPDRPTPYRNPPVAEAVIEVRFEQPIAGSRVEQAANKIRTLYSFFDPVDTVEFQIDPSKQQANVSKNYHGFRLSSIDRDELVIVRQESLIWSRLAPYTGWQALEERAKRDWALWKKTVGFSKLGRLGVRFINRIDVQSEAGTTTRIENYLRVHPTIPEDVFPPMSNYAMQIVTGAGVENFGITINSGSIPSPLIGYVSFALDLDLYRDVDLPMRDNEIWELLSQMRDMKNRAFEACITDNSRRMFG